MYIGSNISSTGSDVSINIEKVWNAIDRFSIKWKSDLSDKRNFFRAVTMSVILYVCSPSILAKLWEKKLDGKCTRMLRAVMNKSSKQHPTKQQLYWHLPPISQNIRKRHACYSCGSKDEITSDDLWWIPLKGYTSLGRPVKPYIIFAQIQGAM